jgi:hypothetical protein
VLGVDTPWSEALAVGPQTPAPLSMLVTTFGVPPFWPSLLKAPAFVAAIGLWARMQMRVVGQVTGIGQLRKSGACREICVTECSEGPL